MSIFDCSAVNYIKISPCSQQQVRSKINIAMQEKKDKSEFPDGALQSPQLLFLKFVFILFIYFDLKKQTCYTKKQNTSYKKKNRTVSEKEQVEVKLMLPCSFLAYNS